MLVTLNPNLMLSLVNNWSIVLSTHPTSVILFGSWYPFIAIDVSLSFLNVILKGLEQEMSKGLRACEVCESKVIMSNLKSITYFMASNVTCGPWPSSINKWQLVWEIPPRTNQLKNERNYLNRKSCHPCLCLHCHTSLQFELFDVVIMHHLSLENVNLGRTVLVAFTTQFTINHLWLWDNVVMCDPLVARTLAPTCLPI